MPASADSGVAALVDRRNECAVLDRLIADVLAGRSRAVVLRGEAGVGKSALLGYLSDRVAGWEIARAAGVESEMELAYSGLHQLCHPMLGHIGRLPQPQRDALATVFGQSSGRAPDRFLVGIATLSLFAEVAEQRPLLCMVDDAQWLDQATAQILDFVARRLVVERVAIVCAARTITGDDVFSGLAEWSIDGLADSDALELLLANVRGPLDAAVCTQIIAESHGNPLALLELPRTWNVVAMAGGFGLPASQPVATKVERSYARRLGELPSGTQLLVLAAAAEPLGDPILLHRAVKTLGLEMAAAGAAVDAGLVTIGERIEFAHPLVRSAAYRSAAADDRHLVHRALAEATDSETDPDRRAWHRARATAGPAEEVAAELEHSAGRAQARGGVAAAAAFLQRAVALTADPARRVDRALVAAHASLQAGAFDASLGLLATAEAGPLDEVQRAQIDLVRAHVAFASGVGRDAPPLLLKAARQLEPFTLDLARETYLIAWVAAVFAGDPAGQDDLLELCRAVRALPARAEGPEPLDLLLDGLALLVTSGHAEAVETLQRAAKALTSLPLEDVLRWGWAATAASDSVWDNEGTRLIAERHTRLVREAGALAQLPVVLAALGNAAILRGDFAGAELLIAEADAIGAATRTQFAPYTALRLLALQGKESEATNLIATTIQRAAADGQGLAAKNAHWAAAVLCNSLGRYTEAAIAARLAIAEPFEPFVSMWALPELVEATTRSGEVEFAREALARLASMTQPCGSDYGLGIEARCRALLSVDSADDLYRESIDRLGAAGLRPDVARAHLLYGEWLRREGRRADARRELRAARTMFAAIGMQAFSERAGRELVATGEKVRKRADETRSQLTPQEEQIARLARDGLTNPEIAAKLFLSPRTIEWHLRKVFTKLDISSRAGLRTSLPKLAGEAALG